MKVFISHSYDDISFVDRLTSFLVRNDCMVLQIEKEILPGDNIITAVNHAVDTADAILVIPSKYYDKSKLFDTEVSIISNSILSGSGKKIIPITRGKHAIIPSVIDQYAAFQVPDSGNYEEYFSALLKILNLSDKSSLSNRNIDLEADLIETQHKILQAQLADYSEYNKSTAKKLSNTLLSASVGAFTTMVTAALVATFFSSAFATWSSNSKGVLGLSWPVVIALFGGIAIGVFGSLLLRQTTKQ